MIEAAVAQYLAANVDGLAAFTADATQAADWSVFPTDLPSAPDRAVCVRQYGAEPNGNLDAVDLPLIQVEVRGARSKKREAHDMAQAIYSALQCLDNALIATGTDDEVWLIGCTAVQSGVVPLPPEKGGDRPRYVTNYRMRFRAPTLNRS